MLPQLRKRSRMYDYGTFAFESRAQLLERAKTFWNPDKTQFWTDVGVDLVIDRREAYFLWDMSGRRLIDMHLNGGTFNLGHRNPEIRQALIEGMEYFDVGNHHFPSVARTALAEKLIETAPWLSKVAFGSGGGEAIDIALKSARHATQRRKIVSIVKAYHGQTRHPRHGQGALRRHVSDHRRDPRRACRTVARPGRVRPHLDIRRRRARLRRGDQDPGDHSPSRGAVYGARHRRDLQHRSAPYPE